MLGKSNDLFTKGLSSEDNAKFSIIRVESQEIYEANMYKEAAKRVVFKNCMNACEIEEKSIPNFNSNFYNNQIKEQNCLQDCYNTRMKIHFGSQAQEQGLLMDMAWMKREYKRYEKWNPRNRLQSEYTENTQDSYIKDITAQLLEKSKAERYGKFQFQ